MSNPYFLSYGSHSSAVDGRCAMEWVSYLANERHSDKPVCVSPMLTEFCIRLNDSLPDEQRQRLRPYLARTIGTRGDGLDEQRRWMCVDWLIREYTPTWLELVPDLRAHADALRSLSPVLAVENAQRAMSDLKGARDDAAAAWDAAWDAAWVAARGAVRDATWDAAWAALAPSMLALLNSILSPGGLLDRLLPLEPVVLPAVDEWRAVCGLVGA